MDSVMMFIIAGIIAAIVLVMFNKQQENKLTNNMYADDVRHLYLLTTAEYKISALENQQQLLKENNEGESYNQFDIELELNRLTAAYKNGEIQLYELNLKLDHLINELDVHNNVLAQVC